MSTNYSLKISKEEIISYFERARESKRGLNKNPQDENLLI